MNKIYLQNLMEREKLCEHDADGKVILKVILRKACVTFWNIQKWSWKN